MLAGVPGGYARDKVAQQPAPTVAVRAQRPGIPVIVEGNTLFEIPEILFTFSPEERGKNHCASGDLALQTAPESCPGSQHFGGGK